MKKQLISLALGITAAFSCAPAVSQALDPPIYGDMNRDWTLNIADLVIMQKFILGTGTIDSVNMYYFDLNGDDRIDVFDYIELKKLVTDWNGLSAENTTINCTFTRCADSTADAQYYKKYYDKEAVITSVSELKSYLSPMHVMLLDETCVQYDTVSEEVYNDFLERYTDEFFSKNVLLLNFLDGVDKYTFVSAQYDTSSDSNVFKIQYYDSSDPNLTFYMPLPPYIAEVTVPKSLWNADYVQWEELEPPFEVTVKSDFTNAFNTSALEYAVSSSAEPQVIKSTDELEEFINGKFYSGVETSLRDTYNSEFFDNNVLIIDLYYQGYRKDWKTSLDVGKDEHGALFFTYDRQFINGYAESGMQINQAVIPKNQFYDCSVYRMKTWEYNIDLPYTEYDLYSLSGVIGEKITNVYSKEGVWIDSAEEMETYIEECFTEEGREFANMLKSVDWDKKSVYIWFDSDVIGSTHRLKNSTKNTDDEITLTFANKQPLSCMGGTFLKKITADKKYSGMPVNYESVSLNNDVPNTDKSYNILQFGSDVVMLTQYTFNGRNFVDIYRLYLGGGPAMFSGNKYVGTVEIDSSYSLVKDSKSITYGSGDKIIMESGEYAIVIEDNQLTFIYKYSADSEHTEQTFEY